MTFEQDQQAPPDEILLWIEQGLRDHKAHILRVEESLSLIQAHAAEMSRQLHAADTNIAAISPRLVDLPALTNQISQLRERLTDLEEQAGANERRFSESLRQHDVESERLRQELNAAYRRTDQVERGIENNTLRFQHLEEASRRLQEATTLIRQQAEQLERRDEAAEGRLTRVFEALKRLEHAMGSIDNDLAALHKQDTTSGERIQAVSEVVSRVERQNDAIAAEVTAQRELVERIELLRAELHRLEDRMAIYESKADGQVQTLQDHENQLGLLEGKDRGFADRLVQQQTEAQTYREQVADQFQRIHTALDRHRRRQIEELERDLRDLKITTFRPPDDGPPAPDVLP